jgi:serine/threonine-protein kinase
MPMVGSRLGSFTLTRPAGTWGGQARFQALGAAGTPHDGVEALVVACLLAGAERARLEATVARVKAITALRHEFLAPIVEAGGWDGGIFLAQVVPGEETLAGRLGRQGGYGPVEAAALVQGLAAALDAAAAAGVPHGDVRLANVWLRSDGRPLLGGFLIAPTDPTATADIESLAVVLASLLAGRQVTPPPATGDGSGPGPVWDPPVELPEVVRATIGLALHPDPTKRYPSAAALVAAYRASLTAAVASQVAGAWEAIERRDYVMAQMLCDAALRISPDNREIAALLLHVRTNVPGAGAPPTLDFSAIDFSTLPGPGGLPAADPLASPAALESPGLPASPGSPGSIGLPASPGSPGSPGSVAPLGSASSLGTMHDPSGRLAALSTLPPELAAMLTSPQPETKPVSGNAWMTLAIGMVILIGLTLIVAMIGLSYT